MQRQRLEFSIKWSQRLYGKSFDINRLDQSQLSLRKTPLFKLYQLIIEALSINNNEAIYQEIEVLFKKGIEALERKDQLDILRILLNFMTGQINNGNAKYQSKMFSLYQLGLKHELLIRNRIISEITFLNITIIALQEKEFEWSKNFIISYQQYLPEKGKEDTINLAQGILFFHQKRYDQTIALLLDYSFGKTLYSIDSKILLLRTYFEQFLLDDSFYDLLIDRTHSLEKYIRRNESISPSKKEFCLNFILFTRKLANNILEEKIDENLYQSINTSKSLVLKSWLLEKITDFKKQKKRPR